MGVLSCNLIIMIFFHSEKAMKSHINKNQFTFFMTIKPLVIFTVEKENHFIGNGRTSYTCSAL